MNKLSSGLKVGLLGGGQLARMLALKGHQLGFEMHVLSQSANDPAAQVVHHHHLGDPLRREDLRIFFEKIDVATFESEFLDPEALIETVRSAGSSPILFPAADLMGKLQDRLSQKNLLLAANLPTLPFVEINNFTDAKNYLLENRKGIVLKQRRFGYDGYGTFHAKKAAELTKAFANWGQHVPPLIAEPRCQFKRELAISLTRNRRGQIIEFPLVESKQVESRCSWVKGPTHHPKQAWLINKLKSFLRQINYVGTIAFELFDTGKDLLINEVAPRVHNSCHYSLEALSLDQFSAHLLAIADYDLYPPCLYTKGFAMMNLIGKSKQTPTWPSLNSVSLHWYGKSENRPGRKMGHINALANNASQALKLVQAAERKFSL